MEEVTTSRWTRSCMFCGFLTWIWYLSIWNPIGCLKLLLSGWTQVIPLTSSLSLFWSPAGQVDGSLMSQPAKWEIISGNIINLSLFAVPRNGRLKMEISSLSHQCHNVTLSPMSPPSSDHHRSRGSSLLWGLKFQTLIMCGNIIPPVLITSH